MDQLGLPATWTESNRLWYRHADMHPRVTRYIFKGIRHSGSELGEMHTLRLSALKTPIIRAGWLIGHS